MLQLDKQNGNTEGIMDLHITYEILKKEGKNTRSATLNILGSETYNTIK